jgi:hypothetical protein
VTKQNRLELVILCCCFSTVSSVGCGGTARDFGHDSGDSGASGSAGMAVAGSGDAGSGDAGAGDAGAADAGSADAGSANAASDGAGLGGTTNVGGSGGMTNSAGSGGAGCQPELDPAFCQRLGKTCGSVTAADNCGTQRTSACGVCSGMQVCGDKNSCIAPLTCTGTSASGPFSIYNLTGAVAPVPAGGVLVDGFYLATTANYYNPRDSVEGGSIEVRSGTVRKSRTVYSTASNSALTGYTFAGSYALSDKIIVIAADNCTYGGTLAASYGYSSSATLINLFDTVNGAVGVVTYQLQP